MSTGKSLTVVIPVATDIRVGRAIDSVDRQFADILVVLNGASEEVRETVASRGVDVVDLPEANGPMACNVGFHSAGTPYVVFLDSDCVFTKGALRTYGEAVGKGDLIRGTMIYAYHNRWQKIVAYFRSLWANNGPYISKPSLMARVGVEKKLGGYLFDRRISWTEDYDLSVRVAAADTVRIIRAPKAKMVHDAMTMREDLRSTLRYGRGHWDGVQLGLSGYAPVTLAQGKRFNVIKTIRFDDPLAPAYAHLLNLAFWIGYKRQAILRKKPGNL